MAESPADRTPPNHPTMGRRNMFVLGGGAAAGLAGVAATALPAGAAPASTAWLCGGNRSISTNGSNFIGPKNAAPLIFKTTPKGGSPTERLRITPGGRVGIGTTKPGANLDVSGSGANVIRATNTSATTPSDAVTGTSTNGSGVVGTSTNGVGVAGTGGYSGVAGSGGSYGGVLSGDSYGAYAYGGPIGVYASGSNDGVYGYSAGGYGVHGVGTVGVYGVTSDTSSVAVQAVGGQYAVRGSSAATAGVRGDSGYVGVWGQGPAYGVYGYSDGAGGYGVMGQSGGAAPWALYSLGNCGVQGTLTKSAGSFRIDHPLDPEHKFLSHSFVESPDMMNVYNGTVVVDAAGEAEVVMPDYFHALNKDFRYQLTPIGAPSPDLHIKSELEDGRFAIGGGVPGSKVSWMVTGVRQDDYARAHPIVVEEDKTADERGTRLFVPAGSKARRFTPQAVAEAVPASTSGLPEVQREHPRPR